MPIPPRPLANLATSTRNDDNGSLFTRDHCLTVGDQVRLEWRAPSGQAEERTLRVTYVMGSVRKGWRACFKGQGALPIGEVTWRLLSPTDSPPAANSMLPAKSQTQSPTFVPALRSNQLLTRESAGGLAIVGFDSAWTITNRGALSAVIITDVVKELTPTVVSFEDALKIIRDIATRVPLQLVGIDQPLVVPNQSGRRRVEHVVSHPIGRRLGGVQPANRKREGMFDDAAPIWRFLEALGPSLDPKAARSATHGTFALEVYPAISNIALFQEPAKVEPLLKYNPDRDSFRIEDWRRLVMKLHDFFAQRRLLAIARWCEQAHDGKSPTKAEQDGVDSLVCLITTLRWWNDGESHSQIVGSVADGYMVVPVDDALRSEVAEAERRYAR